MSDTNGGVGCGGGRTKSTRGGRKIRGRLMPQTTASKCEEEDVIEESNSTPSCNTPAFTGDTADVEAREGAEDEGTPGILPTTEEEDKTRSRKSVEVVVVPLVKTYKQVGHECRVTVIDVQKISVARQEKPPTSLDVAVPVAVTVVEATPEIPSGITSAAVSSEPAETKSSSEIEEVTVPVEVAVEEATPEIPSRITSVEVSSEPAEPEFRSGMEEVTVSVTVAAVDATPEIPSGITSIEVSSEPAEPESSSEIEEVTVPIAVAAVEVTPEIPFGIASSDVSAEPAERKSGSEIEGVTALVAVTVEETTPEIPSGITSVEVSSEPAEPESSSEIEEVTVPIAVAVVEATPEIPSGIASSDVSAEPAEPKSGSEIDGVTVLGAGTVEEATSEIPSGITNGTVSSKTAEPESSSEMKEVTVQVTAEIVEAPPEIPSGITSVEVLPEPEEPESCSEIEEVTVPVEVAVEEATPKIPSGIASSDVSAEPAEPKSGSEIEGVTVEEATPEIPSGFTIIAKVSTEIAEPESSLEMKEVTVPVEVAVEEATPEIPSGISSATVSANPAEPESSSEMEEVTVPVEYAVEEATPEIPSGITRAEESSEPSGTKSSSEIEEVTVPVAVAAVEDTPEIPSGITSGTVPSKPAEPVSSSEMKEVTVPVTAEVVEATPEIPSVISSAAVSSKRAEPESSSEIKEVTVAVAVVEATSKIPSGIASAKVSSNPAEHKSSSEIKEKEGHRRAAPSSFKEVEVTQPIAVKINHFPVKVSQEEFPETVYRYDVTITSFSESQGTGDQQVTKVPYRLLYRIWIEFESRFHKKLGARMPFDGKKYCFSAKRLQFRGDYWAVVLLMNDPENDNKQRQYHIQLQLAKEISTEGFVRFMRCSRNENCELPRDVLRALNAVFRSCPSTELNYFRYEQSFYSSDDTHNINDLMQLRFGHNQRIFLGRQPETCTLNIDMSGRVFLKRKLVVEVMKKILNKEESEMAQKKWTSENLKVAGDFIKGKLIEYGSGKRVNDTFEQKQRYVGNKFVAESAEYKFKSKDGEEWSIKDYFEKKKGITLKYPEWPVVHVGNENLTNYVPLELCYIVPQAFRQKLGATDASVVVQAMAKSPEERLKSIKNSRSKMNFERPEVLKEFGLKVQPEMITIDKAKKLPRPEITAKDNCDSLVTKPPPHADGRFMLNKFYKAAEIPKIGVIVASWNRNTEYTSFVQTFMERLGHFALVRGMTSGVKRSSVKEIFEAAAGRVEIVKAKAIVNGELFQKVLTEKLKKLKNAGCGLVLVVIGNYGDEYSIVKSVAEVTVGILTQCVREWTVKKISHGSSAQMLSNILLKINTKLNGVNFCLGSDIQSQFKFNEKPILFLGADVTPREFNSTSPRVAALTASYDTLGMSYEMHIQAQEASMEVIEGFDLIIDRMLKNFRAKTGLKPMRIIMYRDGVSQGHYLTIKEKEYVQGILAACHRLSKNYHPKITFVVVKRQHPTRFFTVDKRDGVPPRFNIPPGTVVETIGTHPTDTEYFLNSHVGMKGTARPALYHVIHDDNEFSMEELEQLTYCLCYTFVRCTQPVSYPSPTYYAHLAATRALGFIKQEGEENVDLKELQKRMELHDDLKLKYPMFYV